MSKKTRFSKVGIGFHFKRFMDITALLTKTMFIAVSRPLESLYGLGGRWLTIRDFCMDF